eukprot:TRINITY_DN13075_c0_g1_i1.p1 TRINITY_DN13075_c0_g1~~TRINITY_DN13075_c0_g1_i1.p1  ORF type:complete len:545 (-),score=104.08 TRINITY_DN13075_c0_g1_i1:696-2330(-)
MSAAVAYDGVGVSEFLLEPGTGEPKWGAKVIAVASFFTDAGHNYIEFKSVEDSHVIFKAFFNDAQFLKGVPGRQIWTVKEGFSPWTPESSVDERRTFCVSFGSQDESDRFLLDVKAWKAKSLQSVANGDAEETSKFEKKIEAASAKMYFHYYGQLLHQQNMLQDYVRTGTYYAAVIENKVDFEGRIVVDVGAGSGILSLFAAQAGAKHVYAIEASPMAEYAKKLIEGNPILGQRITVIHGKVEEVQLPEKADILISEPMGTLLVNERMLESYVIARDNFMRPGGKMFPAVGRIHLAPFSDEYLYMEIANKALFWQQQSYYGVDLTPLQTSAFQGFFSQPVVDAFDPRLLLSPSITHNIDFTSIKEEDLYDIDIPLQFTSTMAARVHGLACWFDVLFDGSTVPRWLTTGPGAPTTHWYQIRCVLAQPLHVLPGQQITGRLHLVAHSCQSYNIQLTMSTMSWPGAGGGPSNSSIPIQTSTATMDLKEPYYRMSQAQPYSWSDQPQQQQTQQSLSASPVEIENQPQIAISSSQPYSMLHGNGAFPQV